VDAESGSTSLKAMRTYPSAIERFCAGIIIDPLTECWIWIKSRTSEGYGTLRVNGPMVKAHRFAYEFFRGPIPDGFELDHACRNRPCSNPWHLEPLLHEDNLRRSPLAPAAVNERKVYCKRGHEFTPSNTYRHSNGGRECRTCKLLLQRKWRAKRKP
jgi:HNH endonuclease